MDKMDKARSVFGYKRERELEGGDKKLGREERRI